MSFVEPNMERDGFFEGVYDRVPGHMPGIDKPVTHELLWTNKPDISSGDPSLATPVLFGFPVAIDRHVPRLTPVYRQTNNLAEIQGQFWMNYTVDKDGVVHDRSLVPDGYEVEYYRAGAGRVGNSDQTKSLSVYVLRKSAVEVIDSIEQKDNDLKQWQKIAKIARPFGNAVLAQQTTTHSTQRALTGRTNLKYGELKPVEHKRLAEAVFKTVAYWRG